MWRINGGWQIWRWADCTDGLTILLNITIGVLCNVRGLVVQAVRNFGGMRSSRELWWLYCTSYTL